MKGVVAFFSSGRGYGFLTPHGGGKDLFCHFSEIRGVMGFKTLTQGQRVEFDIGTRESDGKEMAINVFPLDNPAEGENHGSRTTTNR